MTLVDSSIWIALAIPEHIFHSAAKEWLASKSKRNAVLFCRVTQQSLLRLLTTKAVLDPYGSPPLTNDVAWSMYDRFLNDRRISFASEPDGLEKRWRELTRGERPTPKLWADAYLAAFAIAGGHELVTADQGFRQFQGLDCRILSLT